MTRYVVELRGLSFACIGEDFDYGRCTIPFQDHDGNHLPPEVDPKPLEVTVAAGSPSEALERVREALAALLHAELDGDIQRREGPSSY